MKHLLDVHNMKMKPKDISKSVEILYQGTNRQELTPYYGSTFHCREEAFLK